MSKNPRNIGRNFEYRVRDFLRTFGWESERNPGSGADAQVVKFLAPRDVRAVKHEGKLKIVLECKKTSNGIKSMTLQRAPLEELEFEKRQIEVFAFAQKGPGQPNPMYAVTSLEKMLELIELEYVMAELAKEIPDINEKVEEIKNVYRD